MPGVRTAATADGFDADSGPTCQYWSTYGHQGDGGYETLRVKAGTYGPSFEQVR
ncbi:hypothetical protein AB0387_29070 [Streptomyces sp. NPDC089173]|uniref:hypothetical protein n=1 Tax=Streptomyces sp. NPDC089173 TaxID=3154965 RepID=UPI00344E8475